MPDINEPTVAEIEAALDVFNHVAGTTKLPYAGELGELQSGEPRRAQIEAIGDVAGMRAALSDFAARRVSSAPSFADGIKAASQPNPNWNGWRSIDTAPENCRVIRFAYIDNVYMGALRSF